jgi:hypothetical protein
VGLASGLYEGDVRHRRFAPRAHDFRYRIFMTLLDLDELDHVFEGRWLWSVRRPALARFRRSDHLGDPAVPLRAAVLALVRERTGLSLDGPVRLLTHLRYFGYCINPVSFYYCHDGGSLRALVAEVHNTPWGERHVYLFPLDGPGPYRLENRKEFHVSPFLPMDMEYRWVVSAPGDRLTVHIETQRDDVKMFDATLRLARAEITGRALAGVLMRHPAVTAKVVLAIYAQALRLWAKGLPYFPHPASPRGAIEKRP